MKKNRNDSGSVKANKVREYKINNDFNEKIWPDNKPILFHKDNERFALISLIITGVLLVLLLIIVYSSKIAYLNKTIQKLQNIDAATVEIVTPYPTKTHIEVSNIEIKETPLPAYEILPLPDATDGSFKSWMDYRVITDVKSKQYALQQEARTDGTGLRMVEDKFIVAMATAYADYIGQELEIKFESGFINLLLIKRYWTPRQL